jgi:hypothetical protein
MPASPICCVSARQAYFPLLTTAGEHRASHEQAGLARTVIDEGLARRNLQVDDPMHDHDQCIQATNVLKVEEVLFSSL